MSVPETGRHLTHPTNYPLHTPTSPLPPTGLDNESSQVILMPLTFPTFRNFITYTMAGAVGASKHQTTCDLDECSMVARWNSRWTINISLFNCQYKIIYQAHRIHTVNFINISEKNEHTPALSNMLVLSSLKSKSKIPIIKTKDLDFGCQ